MSWLGATGASKIQRHRCRRNETAECAGEHIATTFAGDAAGEISREVEPGEEQHNAPDETRADLQWTAEGSVGQHGPDGQREHAELERGPHLRYTDASDQSMHGFLFTERQGHDRGQRTSERAVSETRHGAKRQDGKCGGFGGSVERRLWLPGGSPVGD